ncbi:hypothetical protein KKC32_01525 [Patescibacteria group bacterium]|nr:hypothetical protein [Patescibacteria group bacterium]
MKCIVCEKEISADELIEKHDVNFCCENCVSDYEKKLEELSSVVDWDNCC